MKEIQMKASIKSFIVPVLLSGGWGAVTLLLGYVFLNNVPLGYMFFYPMLLTGVAVAASAGRPGGMSYARAGITGLVSGFIYLLVSPMFPVFASILVGACLGGGLSPGGGRFGGLLNGTISTLKGMIIIPLVITSGEFLGAVIMVFLGSLLLATVFWGAWLGLGVCLIRFPLFGKRRGDGDPRLISGIEEFRSEARDIARDLGEFNEGAG
jgi:hypothetical protein